MFDSHGSRNQRRVQSRTGARTWSLQRSLHAPTIWTETYRTPTEKSVELVGCYRRF
ncbi:MFS transporter [Pararhizobium sp. YC-54]|uniref:MFS transporter n=1 Tax=Pararhizobium sp. YC-54 TaxID=2986920 RepID=UPI0021F7AD97|nr:MFS transporter [Pararhizobium sp. YC-54]